MAASRQRRSETTTYLVQIQIDGEEAWFDVSVLTVPTGTKRRTVFERAMAVKELPLKPGEQGRLRCIPSEHAAPQTVAYDAPEPQLRIVS